MSTERCISLRIDSRLELVSLAGIAIQAFCRDLGLDEMASYQVQTAAIEAINNAIIHAYSRQPGRPVEIHWGSDGSQVTIEVVDRGTPMRAAPPDQEPPPEAETGRGWWIMRRWMDSAEYCPAPDGNRVILKKRLPASG